MTNRPLICAAILLVASSIGTGGPGRAESANIQTIVSVGGPPVNLQQNSTLNMAGVFMVGGSTSATVVQSGANNQVGILQFGGNASAVVSQSGATNFAFIGQSANTTNSVLTQLGLGH